MLRLEKSLSRTQCKSVTRNGRGNVVARYFLPVDQDLYDFKICIRPDGWAQYETNQDAHDFGIWVHLENRYVFTYGEGDLTLTICGSIESLRAELQAIGEFHGPPAPRFVIVDDDGTVTEFYDKRPEVHVRG